MDAIGQHEAYERRQIDSYLRDMWDAYTGQLSGCPLSEIGRVVDVLKSVATLQREHAEPASFYPGEEG